MPPAIVSGIVAVDTVQLLASLFSLSPLVTVREAKMKK